MSFNSIPHVNFKGSLIVPTVFAVYGENINKLNTDYIKKIEPIVNSDQTTIITYHDTGEEMDSLAKYNKKYGDMFDGFLESRPEILVV